jgi:hypothetical protein
MRPSKLLEKSKIVRFGINPFLGLMPNFVGLLGICQLTPYHNKQCSVSLRSDIYCIDLNKTHKKGLANNIKITKT